MLGRITRPLLACCLLLLASAAVASHPASAQATSRPDFRFLESTGALTPEQALQALKQAPAQVVSDEGIDIRNRHATYWLLADLRVDSDEARVDRILRVKHLYPKFDRLELFLFADGQLVDHQINGESVPYSQRPTPGLQMAFALRLESGKP
ncbi:MAG TPA: 7TM-DISM domain-containing protein, partial [Candidatus Kapabacteria bacterium]|nr:7TM-DISM domain-containing protein [Candidatus Kapabacteria bacterium]